MASRTRAQVLQAASPPRARRGRRRRRRWPPRRLHDPPPVLRRHKKHGRRHRSERARFFDSVDLVTASSETRTGRSTPAMLKGRRRGRSSSYLRLEVRDERCRWRDSMTIIHRHGRGLSASERDRVAVPGRVESGTLRPPCPAPVAQLHGNRQCAGTQYEMFGTSSLFRSLGPLAHSILLVVLRRASSGRRARLDISAAYYVKNSKKNRKKRNGKKRLDGLGLEIGDRTRR